MGRHVRSRVLRALAIVAVLVLIIGVLWVDVNTGIWQDVVVLSGIAAGLLTFVLTALVLEPVMARSEHRRWLPVTRLALTDILHALADEQRSELSRGVVHPRRLPIPTAPAPGAADSAPGKAAGPGTPPAPERTGTEVLTAVTQERKVLTTVLGRWAGFLAASADVRMLMDHISALAEHLDDIRDVALELEQHGDPAALRHTVGDYHQRMDAVIAELTRLLAEREDS